MNAPIRVGELLDGKYRVEQVLGEGGMGIVVAARHEGLGQRFAIKVLTLSASSTTAQRFIREARAVSRLEGEHVARVFDVGQTSGGSPFMVMELLEGTDLDRLLNERGRLGPNEAVDYVLQACLALDEAHRAGIVHRDIKPANLFRTRRQDGSPFIKLLDFGVSKQEGAPNRTSASLTATGAVLGSPHYMSPEQLMSSKDVDARADVWSLGVTLYELLTGCTPFPGDGIANVFAAIMRDEPHPMRAHDPHIPAELERVVGRCLDKSPDRRVPNMAILARMLMPFASPPVAAKVQEALGILAVRAPTPFEVGVTAPTPRLDADDLMETVAYGPEPRGSSSPSPPGQSSSTELLQAHTWPLAGQSSGFDVLGQTRAMTDQMQQVRIDPTPTPGLATTMSDDAPPSDPLMVTMKEEPSFAGPSSRSLAPRRRSPLVYVAIGLFAAAVFVLVGVGVWYFVIRGHGGGRAAPGGRKPAKDAPAERVSAAEVHDVGEDPHIAEILDPSVAEGPQREALTEAREHLLAGSYDEAIGAAKGVIDGDPPKDAAAMATLIVGYARTRQWLLSTDESSVRDAETWAARHVERTNITTHLMREMTSLRHPRGQRCAYALLADFELRVLRQSRALGRDYEATAVRAHAESAGNETGARAPRCEAWAERTKAALDAEGM